MKSLRMILESDGNCILYVVNYTETRYAKTCMNYFSYLYLAYNNKHNINSAVTQTFSYFSS